MTRRTSKPSVYVIFDTSCLFVDAADKLIRHEISEFILATNEGGEITVNWYVPQLVLDERKYQMQLRAHRLIPHLSKVETLL
jgi:hypothetical protein